MAKTPLPIPKLIAKAQTVFNAWIRNRDKALGCISCGGPVEQAGHYLNTKYSAFRFNETNVNGQCIRCNMYEHGNLIAYRQGLVRRYGELKVTILEGFMARGVHKWSRLELEAIIQKYKLNDKKEI
jgi:hypothetical protein